MLARANINSRFAERILIVLDRFTAVTFEELFQAVRRLPWSEFIGSTDTFPVKGYSISSTLHSVPDCQKIIKKAVVESLKEDYHINWFDETGPVHQIQFSILKDQVTIMLDTTGTGLHKRGYRPESNAAPIRETLAAALCSLSRLRHYHTLYDPFCGSGTILIEGAMLAANVAPGINRNFACDRWGFVPEAAWKQERARAHENIKTDIDFRAFGSDLDPSTKAKLARGQRIVELFKQNQYEPKSLGLEAADLYAMQKGYFDDVPVDRIKECQNAWEAVMQDQHPDLLESILKEKDLTPEIDAGLKAAIESFKLSWN